MDRRESAALDRWITREPEWDETDQKGRADVPDECDGCGWVPCLCDDRRMGSDSDFSDHALGIDY